jgi:hypothetical protein
VDSAYWKEWELFKLPGGIGGFLIIHFPLWFLLLYGLLEVSQGTFTGYIFSLALSAIGIFAFAIHTYFLSRGREEFNTLISRFILISTLIISMVQMGVTIYCMTGRNI